MRFSTILISLLVTLAITHPSGLNSRDDLHNAIEPVLSSGKSAARDDLVTTMSPCAVLALLSKPYRSALTLHLLAII